MWLAFSRLVSVSICLCIFVFLPLPQLAVLTCAESVERECPCHEDGESFQKELVVNSSARRRLNNQYHRVPNWPHATDDRLHQTASYSGRLLVIVGHRQANGLLVPLMI